MKTFKETGRIVLIEDCGCEELKGYIARCRFYRSQNPYHDSGLFIAGSHPGGRVLGKSQGIAKDLFGTWEDYVLPVQSLRQEGELIEGLRMA